MDRLPVTCAVMGQGTQGPWTANDAIVDFDTLADGSWSCASTEAGEVEDPSGLAGLGLRWWPATVPGTAAGALRASGEWEWGYEDEELLDGRDWWFRCCFPLPGEGGPWDLELGGMATLADVWLNGEHRCHSENMFRSHRVAVATLHAENELVIRCAALSARLAKRHPRPRFKSRLIRHQSMRWYRTSLLGRMPGWSRWGAPVGPWRPVRLRSRPPEGTIADLDLEVRCEESGPGGTVSVSLQLKGPSVPVREARLRVGDEYRTLEVREGDDGVALAGSLRLKSVERWWPHTHGAQPLYPVDVEINGVSRRLRQVGFRTIEIDRRDGAFDVIINGQPCFCRGVVWGGPDAISLAPTDEALARSLRMTLAANVNMVRLGGFGIYEDHRFWDACDELGIMVWQDCMLASFDPPSDPTFLASLSAELREQFGALQGRPALTVACASSETYQQGSMYGLPPERYESEVLERFVPDVLRPLIADVPFLASSPSGGAPPIRPDEGVAHYFGVGAYLRAPSDARLAGVRFAAECLSFANPPERSTLEQIYGTASVAGHDPAWKKAVARDAGTSWDFEDVRDHYVRQLFDVDPLAVRYQDPEWALDLGRAAIVEIMSEVLGYWRRTASGCSGALVLAWQDLWPGAGWGIVDSLGRPKASYFALARAFAPRAALFCDLGLAGLAVDVFNDRPDLLEATLTLVVFNAAGVELESAARSMRVEGHTQTSIGTTELLGGFRDLTAAYRFAPAAYDVVRAQLLDADGVVLSAAHYLPAGPVRLREADVGLTAAVTPVDGHWTLNLQTDRFAQYVSVDVSGFEASASWFHLAPGESTQLTLSPEVGTAAGQAPMGVVRALNSIASGRITA